MAASTSAAVRVSCKPARVSSSRIGITIISGYIAPPSAARSAASLLYRASLRTCQCGRGKTCGRTADCGTLSLVTKLQIQERVALAPFTSIGIGGPARFFARIGTEQELEEALAFQQQNGLPLAVLGGGSNLLVHDEGFSGLVLHLRIQGTMRPLNEGDHVHYDVPAGSPWDDFVQLVCRQGLSGVECLAGIPGLTGGTPVQNVGAYGQEVSQTIEQVRAFDQRHNRFTELTSEECRFGYRTSLFNTSPPNRFLVTHVRFKFQKQAPVTLSYSELQERFKHQQGTPSPMQVYDAVREIRRGKGMLLSADDPESRSAGSFFKNPVVPLVRLSQIAASQPSGRAIPNWPAPPDAAGGSRVKLAAAWLVEKAGFPKGFTDGRVGISSRHSLALINRGGATFADVMRLRDRIRDQVSRNFQVDLEQEPVELGNSASTSLSAPH